MDENRGQDKSRLTDGRIRHNDLHIALRCAKIRVRNIERPIHPAVTLRPNKESVSPQSRQKSSQSKYNYKISRAVCRVSHLAIYKSAQCGAHTARFAIYPSIRSVK